MKLYPLIIFFALSCTACQNPPEQLLRDCQQAKRAFNQCIKLYPNMWPLFCKQKQAEMWLVCRNIKEYRQQRLIRHFLQKV